MEWELPTKKKWWVAYLIYFIKFFKVILQVKHVIGFPQPNSLGKNCLENMKALLQCEFLKMFDGVYE